MGLHNNWCFTLFICKWQKPIPIATQAISMHSKKNHPGPPNTLKAHQDDFMKFVIDMK